MQVMNSLEFQAEHKHDNHKLQDECHTLRMEVEGVENQISSKPEEQKNMDMQESV